MSQAPITLPSPVAGIIHDQSWERPPGNTDWQLTKNAAQHSVGGRAKAIDLGDRDIDRDNCHAMISGKVVQHRARDGVLTIESFDGTWRVVNAHLAIDAVWEAHPLGSTVGVGEVIGHVSNTFPPPTILKAHWHGQVGHKLDGTLTWQDPWPLLAINQFAVLNGAHSNIRLGPSTSAEIFATSKADGIHRAGVKVAELSARMPVGQPPMTVGDGLVWVKASLNDQVVFIFKNLVHFDL
ncbi:MAG: hypothetical protein M3P32_00630 [Chloroflexota bacterium]|nr:hypothetical protein [Chloroflexota bacterium]